VTAVFVKTIVHPWSVNGPSPMRVWVNDGISCPCIEAGGRAGTEARVEQATDRSGWLLAHILQLWEQSGQSQLPARLA
jgi:hypothetical protein